MKSRRHKAISRADLSNRIQRPRGSKKMRESYEKISLFLKKKRVAIYATND